MENKNLKNEIKKQIDIGFSKNEIRDNLVSNGQDTQEVDSALDSFNFDEIATSSEGGSVSVGSILLGVLFVGIAVYRLARYSSGNGNIFVLIGVFSAAGLAVIYFLNKK